MPSRFRSNRRPACRFADSQRPRRGFTLIEMLISVSLVLMMMVLFAEIFGLATESMNLQRAIADGDQQVRSFTTVMRGDLQKRTFRSAVPYSPLEDIDFQTMPFSDRQGYIYISLNDPNNATDNLLQFTVRSTINLESGDETPYFGRATGLVQTNPGATNPTRHVQVNGHQPEHDDGSLETNFTASSTAAEIAYFMRGNRLYRRVVLIRDPIAATGSGESQPQITFDTNANQPVPNHVPYMSHFNPDTAVVPVPIQTSVNGEYGKLDSTVAAGWSYSDDYWLDFDHSAFQAIEPSGGTATMNGARLIGRSGLKNNGDSSTASLGLIFGATTDSSSGGALTGIPRTSRFGFDQSTGISREFSHADPSAPGFFFLGRYTLEEMSHSSFNFPQNGTTIDGSPPAAGQNPFSYVETPALVDGGVEPDGTVDALAGGSRRGQDLMLTEVHAFEIEIWDERIGDFVLPGHSRLDANGYPGDYHRARNRQLFGPSGFTLVPGDSAAWSAPPYDQWTGRTFDTWHWKNDSDADAATTEFSTPPEFRPPPPYRAQVYYPDDGSALSGVSPARPFWEPSTAYAVGDVVFPRPSTMTTLSPARKPEDFSLYYQCIQAGSSGSTDLTEPSWPAVDRGIVEPSVAGEPRWVAIFNVRPLKAIRIRIRFMHQSSQRMRQLSLVHSLVD